MVEFDVNFTRLKTILIIFLLLFFIMTCEIVFFVGTSNETDPLALGNTEGLAEPSFTDIIGFALGTAWAFVVMMFQILTFTLPNIPVWMTIIMFPIMATLSIILVYCIVDLLYSLSGLLPNWLGGA